jgi:hypothetical protein
MKMGINKSSDVARALLFHKSAADARALLFCFVFYKL